MRRDRGICGEPVVGRWLRRVSDSIRKLVPRSGMLMIRRKRVGCAEEAGIEEGSRE